MFCEQEPPPPPKKTATMCCLIAENVNVSLMTAMHPQTPITSSCGHSHDLFENTCKSHLHVLEAVCFSFLYLVEATAWPWMYLDLGLFQPIPTTVISSVDTLSGSYIDFIVRQKLLLNCAMDTIMHQLSLYVDIWPQTSICPRKHCVCLCVKPNHITAPACVSCAASSCVK